MQYLLSQEEFDELNTKREHEIQLSQKKLQKLCSTIANEMPILFWINKEATPWGCGLDPKDEDDHDEFYCDECPVQDICPNDHKHWSQ